MNAGGGEPDWAVLNPQQEAGWMLLWVDAGILALPRSQVRTVEQTEALTPADEGAMETGWFGKAGEPWGAYSLDEQLEPRGGCGSERYTVFVASGDSGAVGFNCKRLKLVPGDVPIREFAPPVCMQDGGPVRGLGLLEEDEVVLISSASALCRHLQKKRAVGE